MMTRFQCSSVSSTARRPTTARATSRRGSATLADAEFTVDYYDTFDYDNYDDLKKADIEPTRSWTFKTDENGYAS